MAFSQQSGLAQHSLCTAVEAVTMTMLRSRQMDPRQATRASAKKLTYADLLSFPDDGVRHEIIDGVHYVTPSPRVSHQRVAGRIHVELATFFERTPIGESLIAPLDVVLSIHDVVEPDVLVVLDDRIDILTDVHIHGAPTIAIEVISPGTRRRDERLKRDLYERVGVVEYWLVYPERQAIRVARRDNHGCFETLPEMSAAEGQALTTPLLPGFALDLSTLFRSRPRTSARR